jgi:hypothetical protein
MKSSIIAVTAILVLSGCSVQPPVTEQSTNNSAVLILSPQGADPSIDNVGFNDLVRDVTQAFATDFSSLLKEEGKTTINVLDQDTKYNVRQKLAIYSVKNGTKTAIVLTIETEKVGDDARLNLRIQYIDQQFIVTNGTVRGVRPESTIERSYTLRGSKSGDNPRSMTDLARDFVSALKAAGRLK